MNLILLYLFYFLLYLSLISIKADDCEYYDGNGVCVQSCPEDMIRHITYDCEEETMSQPTCRNPKPRSLRFLCDQSRCECPDMKVFDEALNKCVALADCSDQSKISEENPKE